MSSFSARQLLVLLLGVAICIRITDAYVPSTPRRTIPYNKETQIISNGIGSGIGPLHSSFRVLQRSLQLYSSDPSTQDDSESSSNVTTAQFGEVTPMRQDSSVSSAKFGDVVSINRPSDSSSPSLFAEETPKSTTSSQSSGLSDVEVLKQRKMRNIGVAIVSIALALGNYAYQWTNPVTPIQLLVNMERSSTPLSEIGKNNKPTVIDFWAPWCENCRYMAPTLFQIEESYKDKVNFVMVNGDDPNNWPLIEALGVDAIPHLAMVEADGTVDTALIGAVPKEWVSGDIDALLENASKEEQTPMRELPYRMLDVFANRPENRKIELGK